MRCLRIRVRGQVQGVGFRPFVWKLANDMGLAGHVLNDPEGVLILTAGNGVEGFADRIAAEAPPLAEITAIEVHEHHVETLPSPFEIAQSQGQGSQTRIMPDAATCPDCLDELRDPSDRRHGYAFANCTNCGPRFTIINAMPYDRAKTTMAAFPMCPDCAAEYANPGDRRFHAQPVACAVCGPHIWLEAGPAVPAGDPVAAAVALLREGKILGVKGLGGFHLVCDAANADSVRLLRTRKRRPGKPFALMGTRKVIAEHCAISPTEDALLSDPAAPIVLLERVNDTLPDAVAPGQRLLGWMLPYTPLHHLLMDGFAGPLVMTSGNLSGEPQVIGNQEARDKLTQFVDAFVMHDREIARRLDDSVERADPPMVLRRARGRVPGTLPLPPGFETAPQAIAYGGQMKGALCLTKGGAAMLGHHLGDLDDLLTLEAFEQADRDYAAIFEHDPQVIACDLHPEFAATRHAFARARDKGLPVVQVQHHHAHMAACMGENLWPLDGGKVAGIVLDGLGLGADGTVWGGELLLGDYTGFQRSAWLDPAPLPGGDMAQKEPWRNALMRLDKAGLSDWADDLFPDRPRDILRQAATKGINAPLSSSAGRLFDAVAACLGICPDVQSYEGEAAMQLEAIAVDTGHPGYDFPMGGRVVDPAPALREMRRDCEAGLAAGEIAGRFHNGLARCFAEAARDLVESGEAAAIALSGGCFQNAFLLRQCLRQLEGLTVLVHRKTPANDGGLALGQALVAAARHVETG